MDCDIIGGGVNAEDVSYYSIGELISLARKFSDKVFRFIDTEYHTGRLMSWRGSYNIPSIEYTKDTVTGGYLEECLISGLNECHTGYKGGDYHYNKHMEFYVSSYGSSQMYKVFGYEVKDFEVILLTKIDGYLYQ